MANKKQKKRNDSRFYDDMDFHDSRKSMRKFERRNTRHETHKHLKDMQHGHLDPDDYEEYYDHD